jgi:large subunit GTPase 1
MVLAKSKNTIGLGNSLMNDRFGKGKGSDRKKVSAANPGIQRTGPNSETYVTNAAKEASWVKMRSVTEQAALDEFLSTAELAGTDFTAEKLNNVKIVHVDQRNPYLLSAADERSKVRKQNRNRGRLTVPRRPKWNENTTPQELDRMERESLLEWRRGLAELQENDDLLMTPFERNLEVWRQLWRVIERSDLIVQIVDARNPLLFRSEDLERYVKEVDKRKRNLLLVNKADMMTLEQRETWASYFEEQGINYKFFSASLAKAMNEAKDLEDGSQEEEEATEQIADGGDLAKEAENIDTQDEEDEWVDEERLDELQKEGGDQRTRILTVDELESLFLANAPDAPEATSDSSEQHQPRKTTIGLVGYPNVGKSSTINALIGSKKVSVSSTPGKTKHFQTIHLSDRVILCDCPGLVFPNFATTKAELVCNGVLPIDQQREFTGPVGLIAQRIPQSFLEAVYGIKIPIRALEEGGTGTPTASEILHAYAKARGFATTGQGQPDESRGARYVLKDYVNGKLLFCHPPPLSKDESDQIDPKAFNKDLYDFSHLPQKRRAQLTTHLVAETESSTLDSQTPSLMDDPSAITVPEGRRTAALDKRFFGPDSGNAGHLSLPFHQTTASGKQLSGRKQKNLIALEKNVDPSEVRLGSSKKHFKGNKRKGKGKAEEMD